MNWFLVLKYLHVLAAIVAVGSNATYGIWATRADRDEAHLGFALRGIKFIDDRVANPAYGVILLSGLVMAAIHYNFTTFWILAGIAGYVVVALIAVLVYSPALRAQIAGLDQGGPRSAPYLAASRRSRSTGPLIGVLLLLIILVMVVKPSF